MIQIPVGRKVVFIPGDGLRVSHPAAGAAWLPTAITGLQLWIDFSDQTTLFTDAGITPVVNDGDLIYQANDKSGNTRHASQTTIGYRPLYKTNQKNGLSVGWSDGSDDWLLTTVFARPQPQTIFIVIKVKGINTNWWYQDKAGDILGMRQLAGGLSQRMYSGASFDSAKTLGTSDYHIVTSIYNGATSKVKYDNDAIITGGNVGAVNGSQGTYLFRGFFTADASNINIGEFINYSGAFSDTDIATVLAYLNAKWAIY